MLCEMPSYSQILNIPIVVGRPGSADTFICAVFLLVNVLYGIGFSYWLYLTKFSLSDQKIKFLELAHHITVGKCPLPKWGEILRNFLWQFCSDFNSHLYLYVVHLNTMNKKLSE